jgi:hypothetical protein
MEKGAFMKAKFIFLTLLVFGLFFTACENQISGTISRNATDLTANVWSDGAVPQGQEQWFRFTATASTQYLHVNFGTMNNMDVQLHTSSGNALGNARVLRQQFVSSDRASTSFIVTSGQVYYVKVTPASHSHGWSNSGTFQIAFNAVQFRPGTFDVAVNLVPGVWTNGNILVGGEQWFRFTATASTQYFHVNFGTMNNMDVQLHTSSGNALGNAQVLRQLFGDSDRAFISLMVSTGQIYYVRVTPGRNWSGTSNSGTYRVAFSASETAP